MDVIYIFSLLGLARARQVPYREQILARKAVSCSQCPYSGTLQLLSFQRTLTGARMAWGWAEVNPPVLFSARRNRHFLAGKNWVEDK